MEKTRTGRPSDLVLEVEVEMDLQDAEVVLGEEELHEDVWYCCNAKRALITRSHPTEH